ncbi:MAG: M56 family metallopeptidase [Bacteroidales bacterium]
MDNLILYLAKSSLGIALFYSTYWLFLRKHTLFNVNRLFLLLGITIPLILPFFEIQYTATTISQGAIYTFDQLDKTFKSLSTDTSSEPMKESLNWLNIVAIIYLTGIAIFFSRLLWQTIELLILIQKNGIQKREGLRVVENKKYGLPFSFINLIFLNPKFHCGTNLNSILTHEKVHIREKHWFDLLLVELITVFFWFNPFVWLIERSIKQNHEYLADQGVLAQGHSVGKYQSILINQIMGMQIIGLTNNLNYSLNKKRMTMMTKTKTSKKQAFRMLWALPAIALLLLAFAKPAYVMDTTKKSILISAQDSTQLFPFTGRVVDGTGEPLNGASIVVYGKTTGTTSNKDGIFTIELDQYDQIVISYVGYTTQRVSYSEIESKLSRKKDKLINFTLVTGVVKLNIDEIISKGAPDITISENKENNNEEVFVIVEEMPSYPGGLYAFAKEIKEKIGKLNPRGKIQVDFTVNSNGITTPKYAEGKVNSETKLLEAIYSLNQKWSPGKQRGIAVPVNFSITTNF